MTFVSDSPAEVVSTGRRAVVTSTGADYWPINWSATWVGALTALAIALIISLIGAAVGAHQLGPGGKIATWHDVGIGALVFAVLGAFFSFALSDSCP